MWHAGRKDRLLEVARLGRGGAGDEAGHVAVADVSGQHDGWAGSDGEAGCVGGYVVDARAAGGDGDAAVGYGEQGEGASEAVGARRWLGGAQAEEA